MCPITLCGGGIEDLQEFMQQPPGHDLLSEIYHSKEAVIGMLYWSELKEVSLGNLSQFKRPKLRVSYWTNITKEPNPSARRRPCAAP